MFVMMGKMNEGCEDVGECEYPFDRPFGRYDEQPMTLVLHQQRNGVL